MACIREPKPGSKNYQLIFGRDLDLSAAEVFHRLATSHHFPPPGEFAFVVLENNSKCLPKDD
jgi:hypothetical protein